MVAITAVRPEDRPAWRALFDDYLAFYESQLDEMTISATFARILDPESDVHGAVARDAEGRPIGLVHWLTHSSTWTAKDYCYLEDLFVAPGARSAGVGAALIEHVRGWAVQNGSTKVYWLTAETNATARALYDRVAQRTGFIHYEIEL
jgi:GNAT superfamily N-acetyltransferase